MQQDKAGPGAHMHGETPQTVLPDTSHVQAGMCLGVSGNQDIQDNTPQVQVQRVAMECLTTAN